MQIETTSICNADCVFCPYPVVSLELQQGNMPQPLFEKVAREGWELGVRHFALYLNNEPFVDPKISDRIAFVRKLGGAVSLSTNGSLMSEQRGRAAMEAGLSELTINMPSVVKEEFEKSISKLDFDTVMRNIEAVGRYHKEYACDVTVQVNVVPDRDQKTADLAAEFWRDRGLHVILRPAMDRAGNLALFSQNIFVKHLAGCADHREVSDLHVIFNGDVLLCCQDWRRTVVLGNATGTSIRDIYFGRKYFEVRKQIYGLTSSSPGMICRHCEFAIAAPATER
jgi:molybdenum cofactor biosynthesis enzyme MoaA